MSERRDEDRSKAKTGESKKQRREQRVEGDVRETAEKKS